MSQYIDGFVIPLPKDEIENYRKIAEGAAEIWLSNGALEYRECVLEDSNAHDMIAFPQLASATDDETVVFAWIVYQSREHRDEVNAKVMADPRMEIMMQKGCPFDCKRMAYGGFKTIVKG
jgi:uncharacterized protein YbaA (DUF1428 family)